MHAYIRTAKAKTNFVSMRSLLVQKFGTEGRGAFDDLRGGFVLMT